MNFVLKCIALVQILTPFGFFPIMVDFTHQLMVVVFFKVRFHSNLLTALANFRFKIMMKNDKEMHIFPFFNVSAAGSTTD